MRKFIFTIVLALSSFPNIALSGVKSVKHQDHQLVVSDIIRVKTLHLSCESDEFDPSASFAGFIIFSIDGKTHPQIGDGEAQVIGGHRVLPGYTAMVKSNATKMTELPPSVRDGQVHGAAFFLVFKRDIPKNMVAEGFSVQQNGEFRFNSITLNTGTEYHDGSKSMACQTRAIVKHYLQEYWMKGNTRSNMAISDLPPFLLLGCYFSSILDYFH
jgi:hypothetical protein